MSNSTAPITPPSQNSATNPLPSSPSETPTPDEPSTVATTGSPQSPSVVIVSSVVTESPSNGNTQPTTVFITSTAPGPTQPSIPSTESTPTTSASSSSTTAAPLSSGTAEAESSDSGLHGGGLVAVAVVVPVVAVALIVLAGIWFWRKRKARKNAEELRKKEIEEYGFNPNNDPTLPPVGSGDGASEMREDNSGYRGWGATSTNRQPSTNLSGGRNIGMAVSDEGSAGYNQPGSPTHPSDGYSNDPLLTQQNNGRPLTGDSETIGALGAAPVASGGRNEPENIHRGPSNASSAYSGANHSDHSGDAPIPAGHEMGGPYYEDGPYYNDAQPSHGPYGDGTYSGGQPVIRDVQAKRNTRIEKPSVYPPPGNSGIAQNF